MWAIIGGSGFNKFDQFELTENLTQDTPFGKTSEGFHKAQINGEDILFLPRHGENHNLLPSEVNYQANIFALKKEGASKILSVSAVGSLQKDLKPGDAVIPNQYIDRTKSYRKNTFCGNGIVGHVSLAQPISSFYADKLEEISSDLDFDIHFKKTYVCIEGPYFSTQMESQSYRQIGANIIGMTNFPEFALAREAGIHYLPVSFVTDYDCWDLSIPHVTLSEVLLVMKNNNQKAFNLAEKLFESTKNIETPKEDGGLKTGLMTPLENIPQNAKSWIEVLRS